MSRRYAFGSSYQSIFHPSQLTGGQLYLRRDQATVSSWISDIGTARDFVQATGTKQPTLGVNKVVFDGTDDFMEVVETDPFFSDSQGIIFFSGYYDSSANNAIFSSSDPLSNARNMEILITSDKIRMLAVEGSSDDLQGSTVLTNGAYYYGYIKGNGLGNPYTFSINAGIETVTVNSGLNQSRWFSNITQRTNLVLGARLRLTPAYRVEELNKLYYNNTALTATEINNMNTFMSDPTNY